MFRYGLGMAMGMALVMAMIMVINILWNALLTKFKPLLVHFLRRFGTQNAS